MAYNKENIHQLLHIQFQNNQNAYKAAQIVNAAIGQQILSPRAAQKWFKQWRELAPMSNVRKDLKDPQPSTKEWWELLPHTPLFLLA
jgi:plasmid rolling circle replication initiator protein Rep